MVDANTQHRRRRRWIIAGVAAMVMLLLIYLFTRPKTVQATHPVISNVAQAITASGIVYGQRESVLAPESSGVLEYLYVREGDRVAAGQLVAQLNDNEAQADLARAEAAVRTAQAALREAEAATGTQNAQIRQVRTEVANANAQASARLATARENLRAANAEVRSARAVADNANASAHRGDILFREGAISRARYEELVTAARTAQAQLSETIARRDAATAEVNAAIDNVTTTRQTGEARIAAAESQPTSERIAVAREQVAEAQSARNAAATHLQATRVTAPYAGTVTEIISQSGENVGPTRGILRLSAAGQPEVRVDLNETDIGQVQIGQQAIVISDLRPNTQIQSRVTRVGARTDPQRGTVEVTIIPITTVPWLRDGSTVDATIIIQPESAQLVVPTTAVVRLGDRSYVDVVADGRIQQRDVEVGTSGTQGTIILRGIDTSDLVVLEPTSVTPGQRVRVDIVENTGGSADAF